MYRLMTWTPVLRLTTLKQSSLFLDSQLIVPTSKLNATVSSLGLHTYMPHSIHTEPYPVTYYKRDTHQRSKIFAMPTPSLWLKQRTSKS
jgi:hypothetical protein